ncbi:metallophosphoesterase family protein [Candidatus Enterococcus ikei]|uniref:Metallophosphoesterase n=1 Tax=Candidatus Enterococcus ikei TaxID=2815326 RepID=A0ABS3GXT5_9ENTE|nr:metallophosphoesterase [Enterococcus sp. DIV0869a]MBO0439640.1 metallophosphoesterase [Enterococcus sp. DIV0869a]
MKSSKNKGSLSVAHQSSSSPVESKIILPPELTTRFDLYPENKRRPVNKTVFRNDYFQLTFNMKENSLNVVSRGDLVYSAIPYDTARNYIQRAAIQYLLHPQEVRQYIESHKANLETYIKLSIFQVTNKRVNKNSSKVVQAYNAIFEDPLFEIQILGRLLQHDETGALSANLAGKFLFSENIKTGISGYVSEYLNFVVQLTQALPIMTDGKNIQLLESDLQNSFNSDKQLTFESDIEAALDLLPQVVKQTIENTIAVGKKSVPVHNKLLLRSEFGKELSEVRKNYTAHSVDPRELEQYFENVLQTENTNSVNVISDIHTIDGKLPFTNKNFNILVGDLSDSQVVNEDINGLYVIGNHELADVLPKSHNIEDKEWEKWNPFFKNKWFQDLLMNPDDSWYKLPVGNHIYYECVKAELEKRFPKMNVLNNSSIIHNGIRYIGLTIPVVLVKRKREQQKFILNSLRYLLKKDYEVPTVIVSHAPLFNELSMLSPASRSYEKNYFCSEPKIEKLFEEYNIIGAIHGHHHIPASSGRYKLVKFAGKELFVVCSIYSKMNTGFELESLLNGEN